MTTGAPICDATQLKPGRQVRRDLRRHLDVLAAPGASALVVRDERRAGRLGAGVRERRDAAGAQRRPVGMTGQLHRAGARLHHQVGRGPVRFRAVGTERRDRHVDQRGVHRGELPVAEAAPVELAGRRRLEEEVRAAREIEQPRPIDLGVEIEHHAALVAREGPPVERALRPWIVAGEWTHRARGRAGGRLDRDHVRAERAQDVAADEATLVGEIEDAIGREQGISSPRVQDLEKILP